MENQNKTVISAFKKADLILLIIIAAIMSIIFATVFSKKTNMDGFIVERNGQAVITFYFDGAKYTLGDGEDKKTDITFDGDIFVIKIFTDESKNHFNEITTNVKDKTVKISESDCSIKKDCVHFPEIKDGKGVIVCMPHGLKVTPINNNYVPIVTGGAS